MLTKRLLVAAARSDVAVPGILRLQTHGLLAVVGSKGQGHESGDSLTYTICSNACTHTHIGSSSSCTNIRTSVSDRIYAQAKDKSSKVSLREKKPSLPISFFLLSSFLSFFSEQIAFFQRCPKSAPVIA